MTTWILIGAFSALVVALAAWVIFNIRPSQVDRYEDGGQSERDVARIVEATGPAPLESKPRPHVRAGTAWGQQ